MSYISIENFKYGLDARRSELTSQAGVLATCENAFVNQGGEVEKRKAFRGLYAIAGLGWEMTKDGLVAFGSAVLPAGWFSWNPGLSTQAYDTGFDPPRIYMRLVSPYGGAMTKVVSTCVFSGRPFIIATFTDGTFAFYDGTVVADSYVGIIAGDGVFVSGGGFGYKLATLTSVFVNTFGPSFYVNLTDSSVANQFSFNFTAPSGTVATNASTTAAGVVTITYPVPGTIRVVLSGTWIDGEAYGLNLVVNGVAYLVGAGTLRGSLMTFCYTYGRRVYVLCGSQAVFSALNRPTVFNDPNAAGAGFIDLSNTVGNNEPLVSMSHYQGKLAFASRQNIQIWQPAGNPANFQQLQVLENTGVVAKLAMTPLGDLDVFYLADSGVRSLRVRDVSSNAYVNDVGAAIDQIVNDLFLTCTEVEKAAACMIVEPKFNRLFVYIPNAASGGKFFCLSYFPTLKIVAWSTFLPQAVNPANSTLTAFTPLRFFLSAGVIYCSATYLGVSYLMRYLNTFPADANISLDGYDISPATIETPWLDGKKPANLKQSTSVDYEMESSWLLKASMDYRTGVSTLKTIASTGTPTPDMGSLAFSAQGTHFKLQATTSAKSQAVLSALIWHYNDMGEKK